MRSTSIVRLKSPLELSHLEWVFICIRSSTRNQFGLFVLSQNAVIHARQPLSCYAYNFVHGT